MTHLWTIFSYPIKTNKGNSKTSERHSFLEVHLKMFLIQPEVKFDHFAGKKFHQQ